MQAILKQDFYSRVWRGAAVPLVCQVKSGGKCITYEDAMSIICMRESENGNRNIVTLEYHYVETVAYS